MVLTSAGNANTASRFGGQRFRAYGPMPTDYGFTGQRQDNTGLIYMNTRVLGALKLPLGAEQFPLLLDKTCLNAGN